MHTMARSFLAPAMTIGPRELVWGARTYIMGVINEPVAKKKAA